MTGAASSRPSRRHGGRRGGWVSLLAAAFALALSGSASAARITVSCSAVGLERDLCREGAEAWAAATGHRVRLVATPNDAGQRLALYQQMLAARSAEVDVLQIDLVWAGLLASHLADLSGALPADRRTALQPALVEANTVGGRLVAVPWFVDVGLLYYRTDLVADAPADWSALEAAAARAQEAAGTGGRKLWGFVFQGRAYEGLTCNALEWISGAAPLIGQDGTIGDLNDRAAAALARAAGWVGTLAPPGVLAYAEEESRAVFQAGDAAFMRNWPYAWSLLNAAGSPVAGRVAVAPLPGGGVLGGQQLSVSAYSANPGAAAELVLWLTSEDEQRRRAVAGGFAPAIPALYDEPPVAAALPPAGALRAALEGAIVRPSAQAGRRYPQVSSALYNAAHAVLAGAEEPDEALDGLERRLRLLQRMGW